MKLNYFQLLSPDPVSIPNSGSIISPRLRDISSIGISTYQYYLSLLLMDNIFDLLTANEQSALLLQKVLNFFIREEVRYSAQNRCFLILADEKIVGAITKEGYPQICDLICQRNCIKSNQKEDLSKIKSKKALEIMQKIQKGRAEKAKQSKSDKNMELGNIISAVANQSQSLNILNIWELTVYQLWDCFLRLSQNNIYHIQTMSVAAWGNKDNSFDANSWFKRMDDNN